MSARSIFFGLLLLVLGLVYGCFFADVFGHRSIRIMTSQRPGHPQQTGDVSLPPINQVLFGFDSKYEFNSIKVVRADDLATNQYPTALWHVVSKDHSKPIKVFTYGEPIEGMQPYLPDVQPDPLEPNVQYVIQIEADSGKIKTQTNFTTVPLRPRR
jgi:hypothetical protein